MDSVSIALLGVIIAQNLVLIKEVYSLKRAFNNHLKWLHKVE